MNCLEPVGLRDADVVPLRELAVPVWDIGLINGVCVSEQVRTFAGHLFLLERHYDRWLRGLNLLGLAPPCDFQTLTKRLETIVGKNADLLPQGAEQGVCFFATPGDHTPFSWASAVVQHEGLATPQDSQPAGELRSVRFFAHTYPLNAQRWRESYRSGVKLLTTDIREVPRECWPANVKIRSRLHYYLAHRRAAESHNGSYPLLLNHQGFVSDSSISSIVGYQKGRGLVVRPTTERYPSTSVDFLLEIAREQQIPIVESESRLEDLYRFDELFLVSTPWCIFPIAEVDQQTIGEPTKDSSQRFATFQQLIAAWSAKVGVSIVPP